MKEDKGKNKMDSCSISVLVSVKKEGRKCLTRRRMRKTHDMTLACGKGTLFEMCFSLFASSFTLALFLVDRKGRKGNSSSLTSFASSNNHVSNSVDVSESLCKSVFLLSVLVSLLLRMVQSLSIVSLSP